MALKDNGNYTYHNASFKIDPDSTKRILLSIIPRSREPFSHRINCVVNDKIVAANELDLINKDLGLENNLTKINTVITFYKTPISDDEEQEVSVKIIIKVDGKEIFSEEFVGEYPTDVLEEISIFLSKS